ncbi:hypothetical protein BDZ90DRAFT_849 [Jaminaea rosea]|uniref:Uncharacterized protein n=1 Tax=Jaminaea rosea TaxID=1569628 RepID=A0A316V029_9BASI|nr:hypothetical protein BDZ90DRAFT_849 [Jaminaea rosea]PWN29911.1 hypothetical protein BDZ90DRAFT_849 [Jaminaea rosea]
MTSACRKSRLLCAAMRRLPLVCVCRLTRASSDRLRVVVGGKSVGCQEEVSRGWVVRGGGDAWEGRIRERSWVARRVRESLRIC